ncbi:MAG: hypothetical protein HKN25_14920, partial [Pyrinomonadaceae bacterium]|nr:hypothetical protein [Pyrinomonadaceae bacterium]
DEEIVLPTKAGEPFSFTRAAPKGTKIGYKYQGKTKFIEVGAEAKFTVNVVSPEKEETVAVGIAAPDGSTAFERVRVKSADKVARKKMPFDLIRRIANSKASPYLTDGKAYFYYAGEAKSVMLAGDFTNWAPRIQLEKVDDGLFVKRVDLDNSARAEYKLIIDGKWMIDPGNPQKIDNGVGGENSIVEMPDYEPGKWGSEVKRSPLDPKISEMEVTSDKYGTRKIKIYIPSEYFKRGIAPKLPVLYMLDGSEYISRAKAVQVLEDLVAAKKVEPFMLVFTDPVDRQKEYWASDEYADYIAKEVVPAVEKKYFTTIKTGRENRAVLGASLGGITSIWIGLRHPDKFKNIGGQSSSFWVDNERVVKALRRLNGDEKFNFYLDDGIFEGVKDTRRVNVMLRGKGFPVKYIEGKDGHNWTSWRDRLGDAFITLMK